jgi:hypothetical protein
MLTLVNELLTGSFARLFATTGISGIEMTRTPSSFNEVIERNAWQGFPGVLGAPLVPGEKTSIGMLRD